MKLLDRARSFRNRVTKVKLIGIDYKLLIIKFSSDYLASENSIFNTFLFLPVSLKFKIISYVVMENQFRLKF